MNNDEDWLTIFLSLGFALGLLFISVFAVVLVNPNIEAKCVERGGQVLTRPGHISSCLYPAK